MTLGVLGVWYCCDITRKTSKEWNGGRAEYRVRSREQNRNKGYIRLAVEWGVWCVCLLFAIVTMIRALLPEQVRIDSNAFHS